MITKKIDKILQEALLNNNLLSEKDLNGYLKATESTGESLKSLLLLNGIVTEKQIMIALSQNLSLKTIDLRNVVITDDIIVKVPVKFAWYYKILPVSFENNVLTLACSNPVDVKIEDELRMHLGVDLAIVLTEEPQLTEALKKHYGLASETIDRIMTVQPDTSSPITDGSSEWIEDLEKETDNPTVSNLVNQIILEAYQKRATDIHIEPYRNKVRFRYRIDGVLVDANLPGNVKNFLQPILSRIKILANLSITEKRLPQDGSAVVRTKDQHLDLRVSTMPTPRGESMVIRILPSKVMLFSLEKLGFNPDSIECFRELIKKPHGIIFITGPTGSGKTTTLYACLNEINSSERKIITIEDPVEYEMDGITQVQVNPKVNFQFSTGLRSLLRHDPDIIMVGEVRDPETAEIAIKTALTGHLVFSTLHTNDASSGITRLVDMGVEPYLVASSVEAFVAQRLVRVICPECKEEDENPILGIKKDIAQSLDLKTTENIKIYKGTGCDHCNQTGYYGRLAIYEILIVNDTLRGAILEKPRSDYIKKVAMQEGLKTLRQNGWKAVLDGITTPDEILNVTVKDDMNILTKDKDKDNAEETVPIKMSAPVEPAPAKSDYREELVSENPLSDKQDFGNRIYPRTHYPVNFRYTPVQRNAGKYVSNGEERTAISDNISAGGFLFSTQNEIALGTILKLDIMIESVPGDISCYCKVSRVDKNTDLDNYSVAGFYLDISREGRSAINTFIEQQIKAEEKIKAS